MRIQGKLGSGLFVFLMTLASGGAGALAASSGNPAAGVATHSTHTSQALPAALRPVFYQALAKDMGAANHINKDGCALLPKQNLEGCFDSTGAHFKAKMPLSLHLIAFGRGNDLVTVPSARPQIEANRASYVHGNLTEWWRVLPIGFEQGFTIAKRPGGTGELTLALSVTGQDAAAPSARHSRAEPAPAKAWGGNPVETEIRNAGRDTYSDWMPAFTGMTNNFANGTSGKVENGTLAWGRLRYGQLVVTDAKGKVVPATLTTTGNQVRIAVNDVHAAYPLTVDPLVWLEQKVTASDGAMDKNFGTSVAVSGSTALVGAPGHNNGQGAAYVFSNSGGSWTQTAELVASDGEEGSRFGSSVALVGTTAIVGAPFYNNFQGAAYVFSDSGGSWTQTAELLASDGAELDEFGASVALAGSTALVGAPSHNNGQTAAYVFSESGGSWTQTAEFTASDGAEGDGFGTSVAVSGSTALVGAPGHDNGQGAAYVFSYAGGSWTQTAELLVSHREEGSQFGFSVALAGTTALVGAPSYNNSQGAVYVFGETGGSWAQTAELLANDGSTLDEFGASVALAGTTALVGAFFHNDGQEGAAYVFRDSGGSWAQMAELLASDGARGGAFGYSVALAGTTALISAPSDNEGQGAAYFEGESDLGLSVSAPQTVGREQEYTSQTIATNNASAASPTVTATITVPAAASFISATATQGSCSEAANFVTCDFGEIGGNAGTATANVTLKAIGDAGTTIDNVAGIAKATPSLTASASTVIEQGNTPPVAKNGTLSTEENTPANGTLEASDPDGDPLTFIIMAKPEHGTISQEVQGSNAYLYTPDHGYSGADSFTFKANDGQADSNIATISITVKAAPPPPPPPSGGGGGGGATGLLGLGLLALAGGLTLWRRRQATH